MNLWLISVIVFLAIFTQSVAGFGMALVAMPLLTPFFDMKFISPLIAIVGVIAKILLLFKYKHALDLRALGRLTIASLVFVPLGVYALDFLDQALSIRVLGVVVVLYAVYDLFNLTMPRLEHKFWAYFFGALAGLLGGAYNASGPPVVIYANSRRWLPAEFKGNLQGYALVNGVFIVISHILGGNADRQVWWGVLLAVPAVVLAVWAGSSLDRYFNPQRFRKLVLWLLVALGLSMVF